MVVNKRKKSTRARGSRSHFYGSHKKHRGAGHRGGRGNAGSGKKADQKKPSIWKDKSYFGNYGFVSKTRIHISAINLKELCFNLAQWIRDGIAKQESGKVVLNLADAGYNKILSNGEAPHALFLTTPYASSSAVEKITAAGGAVDGLKEKKQKKKAPEKSPQA